MKNTCILSVIMISQKWKLVVQRSLEIPLQQKCTDILYILLSKMSLYKKYSLIISCIILLFLYSKIPFKEINSSFYSLDFDLKYEKEEYWFQQSGVQNYLNLFTVTEINYIEFIQNKIYLKKSYTILSSNQNSQMKLKP